MSAREECVRIARLLERLDEEVVAEPDMEIVAAHLESCVTCGVTSEVARPITEAVRDHGPELPDDGFFAAGHEQIMAAVLAEPGDSRPPARAPIDLAQHRERTRQNDPRRIRIMGTIAAVAAAIALVASVTLLRDGGDSIPPVAAVRPAAETGPVEVVSVDHVDVDELLASDDAWILASYDIFDVEVAAPGGAWAVEDLSDDELDALEGVFGAAPSLG